MQSVIEKFQMTGIVPRGFVATNLMRITIQTERLVQSIVVVTDAMVREGRSVRKARPKVPLTDWQLYPINAVVSLRVKPSGITETEIFDLSR